MPGKYRRKYRKGRTGSAKYIAKVARNVFMRITETKKYNMSADFASDAAGDFLINLTEDIAQGDTDSTRDGDKILVTKLFNSVTVSMADNQAVGASQFYRVMVVQTRGKQLTNADLPSYHGSADTDKFFVHYDHKLQISSAVALAGPLFYGSQGRQFLPIKIRFKKPINVHYDDATAGYQNHLYMYICPYNEDARSKTTYTINTYFKDT